MDTKGFTLIELLVSVAIVGILAATSLALYDTYKDKAALAEIQYAYRDVVTVIELLQTELEVANQTLNYVTFNARNTTDGNYAVTSNNTSISNNFPLEFLSGHTQNSDRVRFWIVASITRNTRTSWYSGGATSCVTSPGHVNYIYYRRNFVNGVETSLIDNQKSHSTFYGQGGTYC